MQEQTRRTKLPSRSEPLRPGDPSAIGAYALVGRLGEGGMGAVYLGRDGGGRYVAIKVIRSELSADEGFRARFRDEVSNAQRVASFCTAKVLDHGEDGGRPYLVTEYVDGTPLDEYIENGGPLPDGTLNGVAVGVAAALTAIHAAGLIHRDLKPPNVMLSVSGPRVIDFGIARAADAASGHTQAGFVVGTPGWMAPEQVMLGDVSTAADVFAWGCLVAFAGTGRHPHGSGTVMTMAARAENGEHDLTGLAEPLRALVERALDPDPARRPEAQELLLELVSGGAAPPESPGAAQAAVDAELTRTWRAEALPPPWIPPSPPQGVQAPTRAYEPSPPPRPMPPPPPGPWPQPPVPAPAPPQRRRGRGCMGCLIAVLVVAAMLVTAVVVAYRYFQPVDGQQNKPAKDGQFTFVASAVSCGVSVRGMQPYTGNKLCRVKITVTNTGTKTRTLSADRQKLYDHGEEAHTARRMLKGSVADARYTSSARVLAPGARFSGQLIFEIVSSARPVSVVLHDAPLSKGVRIPARSS
ncbi:protein kinase [Actinomadura madurae]|uniref:serine/threonine-protein kinase n=3 Tax=Actinomadura madurae TaxID=1993 RepID=UPI002025C2B7|nr:serine/threonine-protein kinase [Actinomadura madurae]URM98886.1 protein kinase [Actinomadura madurae]URN09577.1 protein kinase [Actinomadura madurae]